MHSTSGAIFTILAISAVHWYALEARWAGPEARNGYTEYPIPIGLRLLLTIVSPVLLYGAVANLFRPHGEKWVSILLAGIAFFCLYFTPATLLCSSDRLISIRFYGVKKISMKWADVTSVYLDRESNSITVRDKLNRTVIHTAYNVGREEFITQLRSLPYSFPRML